MTQKCVIGVQSAPQERESTSSLAWPDPSCREKRGKVKRGGVKEEGSGDWMS